MTLKRKLSAFVDAVITEAERNDRFRHEIEQALGTETAAIGRNGSPAREGRRKGGRRSAAIVDPVDLARQGEALLRERLSKLDLEQLRDVVAQHGMDPGKLVMKWKDQDRVIERIVEMSLARATKGDAFRSS